MEFRVDATAGVCEQKVFDAEGCQDANRESYFGHRITFVKMTAAGEEKHGDLVERPDDQFSGMSGHGWRRKAGQLGVGNFDLRRDFSGKGGETAAEDNGERG